MELTLRPPLQLHGETIDLDNFILAREDKRVEEDNKKDNQTLSSGETILDKKEADILKNETVTTESPDSEMGVVSAQKDFVAMDHHTKGDDNNQDQEVTDLKNDDEVLLSTLNGTNSLIYWPTNNGNDDPNDSQEKKDKNLTSVRGKKKPYLFGTLTLSNFKISNIKKCLALDLSETPDKNTLQTETFPENEKQQMTITENILEPTSTKDFEASDMMLITESPKLNEVTEKEVILPDRIQGIYIHLSVEIRQKIFTSNSLLYKMISFKGVKTLKTKTFPNSLGYYLISKYGGRHRIAVRTTSKVHFQFQFCWLKIFYSPKILSMGPFLGGFFLLCVCACGLKSVKKKTKH